MTASAPYMSHIINEAAETRKALRCVLA